MMWVEAKVSVTFTMLYTNQWLVTILVFTKPILQDGWVSTSPCLCVCLSLTLFQMLQASPVEDEENEIYSSSREEGQFILDL